MTEKISQSQYQFYIESNIPYRGYVEGLGFVDNMYKSYMTFSSFDLNGGSRPSIGYIPTIDFIPSKVIRSYGDAVANMIADRLLIFKGGNVDVNLGNYKHLRLSAKNKYQINYKVENLYQNNALFKMSFSYVDDKGKVQFQENSYDLDGLLAFFPDADLMDLYVPKPENDNILELLEKIFDVSSKVSGASSLLASSMEIRLKKTLPRDVEKFIMSDRSHIIAQSQPRILNDLQAKYQADFKSNVKFYFNENGQKINYFNKKGTFRNDLMRQRFYNNLDNASRKIYPQLSIEANLQAHRNAYIETEPILRDLQNGQDPRTHMKHKTIGVLGKVNKGLNWFGLGISIINFSDYCYKYDGDIWNNGKTYRMMADMAFAGVAFIPGWGWIASGSYFLITTFYDVFLAPPAHSFHNPMRNIDIESGMPRDKTRVNLENTIMEVEMKIRQREQEMQDRKTPMVINGVKLNMSRYDWKMLHNRNLQFIGPKK